jgi:hypothetical protein
MDTTTRYFFNKETGQFIQLAGLTIEKPFSDEWVEISRGAFVYLMELYNRAMTTEEEN